jgi:hypothetical protein
MRIKSVGAIAGLVGLAGGGAFIAAHAPDHDADRARGQRYAVEHDLDRLLTPATVQYRNTQCASATRALYPEARSFASGDGRQLPAAVAFWEGCAGGVEYSGD